MRQVVDGKLTAGELSTFVIYALYVGTNVGALAGVISNLIQVGVHGLQLNQTSHECPVSWKLSCKPELPRRSMPV